MALIDCAECGGKVSTSAPLCPHCGFKNPSPRRKLTLIEKWGGGFLLAVVVMSIVGIALTPDADPKDDGKSDSECMADLNCWADRHHFNAEFDCSKSIERALNTNHEWLDTGFAEKKFTRVKFSDSGPPSLTYFGDKILFQNAFGAWVNHVYLCEYDPVTKRVLRADAEPGRLAE